MKYNIVMLILGLIIGFEMLSLIDRYNDIEYQKANQVTQVEEYCTKVK